uniref:Cysteine-rich venom protein-like n=1 Tax=Myripristis murdjan TaxID=586833 RepID=A0A667XIS9_9TELE
RKMFVFLICILTLHTVHSAYICTENPTVQAEIVDQHNAFRRAVEPTAADMLIMNWSDEIAATAQAWVDKCILSHGPVSTRMLEGYAMGENLFFASAPHMWTDVINAWHSEVENYQYPNGSTNGKAIGHYTQVVWYSSYKVGCGAKLCPGNIYFYGCHYYRAGNFRTVAPYKAGPPCASCPNSCENKLCNNPCPYINRFRNCPALKKQHGCSNTLVYAWCPAECKCNNEIIAVG